MAIIANQPKNIPHTIQILDSGKVPYATPVFLDSLLSHKELNFGIKRNNYYMINTGSEFRGYTEHTKNFQIFEQLIHQCRMRGASLLMIKFDTNV